MTSHNNDSTAKTAGRILVIGDDAMMPGMLHAVMGGSYEMDYTSSLENARAMMHNYYNAVVISPTVVRGEGFDEQNHKGVEFIEQMRTGKIGAAARDIPVVLLRKV